MNGSKILSGMTDISGTSLPKKMIVRCDSSGFRAKVWYRNGAGPVLWRWFWYFADAAPSIEEAISNAQRVIQKAKADVELERELERGMWAAMAKMR